MVGLYYLAWHLFQWHFADCKPSLLLFSSLGTPQFRTVKLRARQLDCSTCGVDRQKKMGDIESIDYMQLCGGPTPNWRDQGLVVGDAGLRIQATVSFLSSRRLQH